MAPGQRKSCRYYSISSRWDHEKTNIVFRKSPDRGGILTSSKKQTKIMHFFIRTSMPAEYVPRTPFFFFSSHLLLSPFSFSLPPRRNSDPGSHSKLFSPPLHYGSYLLSREDFSSFLVDSRRIVLPHSRRSQQLILFFFANKFKISPRRDSKSRTNTRSIRGVPLVHRGERHIICRNCIPPASSLLFMLTWGGVWCRFLALSSTPA